MVNLRSSVESRLSSLENSRDEWNPTPRVRCKGFTRLTDRCRELRSAPREFWKIKRELLELVMISLGPVLSFVFPGGADVKVKGELTKVLGQAVALLGVFPVEEAHGAKRRRSTAANNQPAPVLGWVEFCSAAKTSPNWRLKLQNAGLCRAHAVRTKRAWRKGSQPKGNDRFQFQTARRRRGNNQNARYCIHCDKGGFESPKAYADKEMEVPAPKRCDGKAKGQSKEVENISSMP